MWKSLQNCRIGENLDVINSFIKQYTNNQTHCELLFHLQGLKAILEILLADIPHGNRTVRLSFMTFDEGFSLFASYNPKSSIMQLNSKDERKRFKELLCHPWYGLCIYITENHCNKKFIVLRPDEFDLKLFLEKFCDTDNEATNSDQDQLVIDNEFVEKILLNMDTEWDKNIVRVLLSLNRSRAELDELGIESDHIVSKRQEIQMVLEERSRAEVAAKDILKLRLESQKSNINKNITESEVLLEKKVIAGQNHNLMI